MESTQRMMAIAVGVGAPACAVAGVAFQPQGIGSMTYPKGTARTRTLGTTPTFTDNPTGPFPEPPV